MCLFHRITKLVFTNYGLFDNLSSCQKYLFLYLCPLLLPFCKHVLIRIPEYSSNKQVFMFFSLNEAVKEVFSGEVMSKLAGLLGESQANLQKALQAAIPSVLTGIVLKAESSNAHDHFREV